MTSKKRLVDILKSEKQSQEATKVDWEARRKDWLSQVASLYTIIESWLKPSI